MASASHPVADDDMLGDVLQFMRLMWAVDHQLQSVSKRMAAVIGLTGPQRLSVRLIGRVPGVSAGELASLLHLDPSTVTGIVRRLEEAKMIERTRDEDDARRSRLRLTARGREVDRRSSGTVEAAVRRVLATASPHDLAAAARVLGALAGELEALTTATAPSPVRRRRAARA
jgi:DNA-binding MarR family transcriptional regulator